MKPLRTLLLALIIGLLPAIGNLLPSPVLADTLIVSSGGPGFCSYADVKNAIEELASDGDVIEFNCSRPTIFFDDPVTVDKDLTIDGSNLAGEEIILRGGDQVPNPEIDDQLFLISEGAEVTMRHLTFYRARTPENGGAIYNQGALTIERSKFEENHAGLSGGAIYNTGTLNVRHTDFYQNTAEQSGGAIENIGVTTIVRNWFVDNEITADNNSSTGGAISNSNSMKISQSLFGINKAVHGAAVRNNGSLEITQSRFEQNRALSESGTADGGAIDNHGTSLEISQTTIDENEADEGGAIHHAAGTLTVSSSTLTGNLAPFASAILVDGTAGQTTLRWSTIVKPGGTAPALYLLSDVTLEGVILAGDGDNCMLIQGDTNDSYSLSDDDTCVLNPEAHSLESVDPEIERKGKGLNGITHIYYSLGHDGPAMDAGGSGCAVVPEGEQGPAVDQLGTERPTDGTCDIGAIEWSPLNNDPPVISDISVPEFTDEGQTVTVSFTAQDRDGDAMTYAFDCQNDGIWEVQNSTASEWTCTYADNGRYEVLMEASDGDDEASRTAWITVNNLDPVIISFTADPNPALVNQRVMLTATADDPGDDEVTFSYGCDGGTFDPSTPACTFTTSGTYEITVTADDGEGGTSQDGLQLVVTAPPVIEQLDVASTLAEGGTVTVTVGASDQDQDPLTYAIDCDVKDGVDPAFTAESSTDCTYPDQGSYEGKVQVTDGTNITSQPFFITVNNSAPAITNVTADPNPAVINQPVTLSLEATDVPADGVTFSYDCGNGETGSIGPLISSDGAFSATSDCNYAETGSYTITVTASDEDQGVSAPVTVPMLVADPVDLCANRWNGSLRWPADACSGSETLVKIPSDPMVIICASGWNGEARYSPSGSCGRYETRHEATGMNTIPVCVNQWNGALRVSEVCSSSEQKDAI